MAEKIEKSGKDLKGKWKPSTFESRTEAQASDVLEASGVKVPSLAEEVKRKVAKGSLPSTREAAAVREFEKYGANPKPEEVAGVEKEKINPGNPGELKSLKEKKELVRGQAMPDLSLPEEWKEFGERLSTAEAPGEIKSAPPEKPKEFVRIIPASEIIAAEREEKKPRVPSEESVGKVIFGDNEQEGEILTRLSYFYKMQPEARGRIEEARNELYELRRKRYPESPEAEIRQAVDEEIEALKIKQTETTVDGEKKPPTEAKEKKVKKRRGETKEAEPFSMEKFENLVLLAGEFCQRLRQRVQQRPDFYQYSEQQIEEALKEQTRIYLAGAIDADKNFADFKGRKEILDKAVEKLKI